MVAVMVMGTLIEPPLLLPMPRSPSYGTKAEQEEEFLARYQGFWTQKQASGCVVPTASYQVLAGCVQRKLYLFAEQKVGSGVVSEEKKGPA